MIFWVLEKKKTFIYEDLNPSKLGYQTTMELIFAPFCLP